MITSVELKEPNVCPYCEHKAIKVGVYRVETHYDIYKCMACDREFLVNAFEKEKGK
jgi:DNA-directed RNA polymerase subunit RPC12/RpoP